jgi:hypothetical protein
VGGDGDLDGAAVGSNEKGLLDDEGAGDDDGALPSESISEVTGKPEE